MTKYTQIINNESEWKVNDSTEYYSLLNKEVRKSLEEVYKNYLHNAIRREIADYKDHVIDLLKCVCTENMGNVKTVSEMEGAK